MSDNLHEMPSYKRERLYETLRLHEENEQKLNEEKEIEKHTKNLRKRRIIVNRLNDLLKKYENYQIRVDVKNKLVILRKPLEVKYLARFKYDCKSLGFNYVIRNRSINDLYYQATLNYVYDWSGLL